MNTAWSDEVKQEKNACLGQTSCVQVVSELSVTAFTCRKCLKVQFLPSLPGLVVHSFMGGEGGCIEHGHFLSHCFFFIADTLIYH